MFSPDMIKCPCFYCNLPVNFVMENDKTNAASPSLQCVDALKMSLCIEKEGLVYYEKAAKRAVDPRVKEVFRNLAEEEKEHIQTLQEKTRFLKPALGKHSTDSSLDAFYAQSFKGKIFPDEKGKQQAATDIEALEIGVESEKKSIEVLNSLLENEKKIDVRAIFLHLIAEEKRHLQILQTLRDSLPDRPRGDTESPG